MTLDAITNTVVTKRNAARTSQAKVVSEMQLSLSKFAKSNDRRMVLRTMQEVKMLRCIQLDQVTISPDNLKVAEDELVQEGSVILNGIPFHGSHHFLTTLKELCWKLCEQGEVDMKKGELYENLVLRMARTTSAADSYFKLNSLVGSPDLMLMPTTQKQAFPIKVSLYVGHGSIHSTITTTNTFGLFRKTDLKGVDLSKGGISARPWIGIQAVVDERCNISTGSSVRSVRVQLPDALY